MAAVQTTAVSTRPVSARPARTGPAAAVVARPLLDRPSGGSQPQRRHPAAVRRGADDHERAPVAAVVALLVLLTLGWPLAGLVGSAGAGARAPWPSASAEGRAVHVVQPGETYWSIAEGLGPPGDLRPTVDALTAANDHRPLRAGDRIVVPAVD